MFAKCGVDRYLILVLLLIGGMLACSFADGANRRTRTDSRHAPKKASRTTLSSRSIPRTPPPAGQKKLEAVDAMKLQAVKAMKLQAVNPDKLQAVNAKKLAAIKAMKLQAIRVQKL